MVSPGEREGQFLESQHNRPDRQTNSAGHKRTGQLYCSAGRQSSETFESGRQQANQRREFQPLPRQPAAQVR